MRAIDHTVPVFLFSYLGIAWLLWGDGSLLREDPDGEALTGLARWLCLGWVPCAALAGCGYLLALYRGALVPWSPAVRLVFPLGLLALLPLLLTGTERLVHSLHDDALLACDGRLRCAVGPERRHASGRGRRVYGDAVNALARASRTALSTQELPAPPDATADLPAARSGGAAPASPAASGSPRPVRIEVAAVPGLAAVVAAPLMPGGAELPSAAEGDPAGGDVPSRPADTDPALEPGEGAETEAAGPPRRAEGPVEGAGDRQRIRTGAWVERAPDGQKLAAGRYENGVRHGPWREWYLDGTPKLSATYVRGEPQGDLRYWHSNGELERSRIQLTTGDGLVLWVESRFDPAGRRIERSQYENGTLQGPQHSWDGQGTLRSAGSYSGGEKHGSWMYWSGEGRRTRHEVWDSGRRLLPPARREP